VKAKVHIKSRDREARPAEKFAELRHREDQLAANPSAAGYLELADEYHNLGLNKESDRLLQLAEAVETGGPGYGSHSANGLMFGAVDPVMLIEVIQILSRTTLTGELIIDAPSEAFHIFFNQGHVINAVSQSYPCGIRSFRQALQATFGTYRFIKRPVDAIDRVISSQTEVLLMEAIHHADEERAAQ